MISLSKPTLAIVYGAICGGCDVTLVNLGESLIKILESYNILYWPIAIDSKKEVLEKVSSIDVSIYMGTLTNSEEVELAKLIRSKSRVLIAYGTCAIYGGIPGLRALINTSQVLKDISSTINTITKKIKLPKAFELPWILDKVKSLIDIVEPDIIVPGCPPSDSVNETLVNILLDYISGIKPKGKIFIGEPNSLCSKCNRKPSEFSKISMPGIRRLHELKLIEDKCFLEQGILCMGPVTRAACDLPCIKNNLPCMGCNGPPLNVEDMGLEMVSTLSSILLVDKEKELLEEGLSKELDKIIDLLGLFYRYTLPHSLLTKLKLGGDNSE